MAEWQHSIDSHLQSILPSCHPAILQFMNLNLSDKVAIVTGSSRGLGLASARALVD